MYSNTQSVFILGPVCWNNFQSDTQFLKNEMNFPVLTIKKNVLKLFWGAPSIVLPLFSPIQCLPGNPVPGNQEFCFSPRKTMVEQVKKKEVSFGTWFEDEDFGRYFWS